MSESEMQKLQAHVETLIKRASSANDSGDAMRFSQAAVNAANAIVSLKINFLEK